MSVKFEFSNNIRLYFFDVDRFEDISIQQRFTNSVVEILAIYIIIIFISVHNF